MFWQQCNEAQYKYMQSFQDECYGELCNMMVSICTTFQQYNTFYREIMPTMHDLVNGCNHGKKFCLTFFSQMRLNLAGVSLLTKGICTLGHKKTHITQHNAIFNRNNRSCVTEGLLPPPYYRNFLEKDLPLYL
jgi:hypothetical protein